MSASIVGVLKEHLGVDQISIAIFQDWIIAAITNDHSKLFDLKRDIEELEQIDLALRSAAKALEISNLTNEARALLLRNLDRTDAVEAHDAATQSGLAHLFIAALELDRGKGELVELKRNIERTRSAIGATKVHILLSTKARKGIARMNHRGMQVVNVSSLIWTSSTGEDVPPKELNEASRFGKFLCDMFDACELKSSPRASFRAWRKLQ